MQDEIIYDKLNENHRSGYVALVGRPNAGKSTLLNHIVGSKLVAVTPRPQTTRHRILGIFDREDAQVIFQDTPGLLDSKDEMHAFMMREAHRSLEDADLVIWLIDSIKGITQREKKIAEKVIADYALPIFVAFNKTDKIKKSHRNELVASLINLHIEGVEQTFFLSALQGDGVDTLLEETIQKLPTGPKFFPPDQLSDRAERFFVEEIIREKAFLHVHEEIPHSLAVQINSMKEKSASLTTIEATLHVEKASQKGIVVGKGGRMIKSIGTAARKELEEFLGKKVFLELYVKVSEKWRKKGNQLKDFGYSD